MNDCGVLETVGRHGESVVAAAANIVGGGLDAVLCEALGVSSAEIQSPLFGMMFEAAATASPLVVHGLLEIIADEAGMCCRPQSQAENWRSINVDDKREQTKFNWILLKAQSNSQSMFGVGAWETRFTWGVKLRLYSVSLCGLASANESPNTGGLSSILSSLFPLITSRR